MDGVSIRDFSSSHQMRDIQVGISAGRPANTHRLICELHMEAVLICGGINRHGLDTHLPAGTDDPEGDLAAIGDEYLLKVDLRIFSHVISIEQNRLDVDG